MKILIVGFGNMGCRHAQSLIQSNMHDEYFVIEPNKDFFRENLKKINIPENKFTFFEDISSLPSNIDFAIIATNAFPRYQIMKELIEKGIKYFLLEKIIFQSKFQFDDIISLMEKKSCVAYGNFVNRYYPNYIELKKRLTDSVPLSMVVSGGDFGLGCNGLHYIDLFEYFTGKKAFVIKQNLNENPQVNKRGSKYKELFGQIVFSTNTGDRLIISSIMDRIGGIEISIIQNTSYDIINEETRKHIYFSENEDLQINDFNVLRSSHLTNIIYNDILEGRTLLPSISEVKNCHLEFFKAANSTFGLTETELCPLT